MTFLLPHYFTLRNNFWTSTDIALNAQLVLPKLYIFSCEPELVSHNL